MLKQSHQEEPPCAGNYSQDTDWPPLFLQILILVRNSNPQLP